MTSSLLSLLAAAVLTVASIAVADARVRVPAGSGDYPPRQAVPDDDPPEGFQPRLSAQRGVLCVKQCPNDQLPCDPPSFKVADGRCSTQWR